MTKAAYKIKYLFGAYSYRGFVSIPFIVGSMATSGMVLELTSDGLPKARPSDTPPPVRPHLLILPKQVPSSTSFQHGIQLWTSVSG